jgi:hypothetical protein
MDEVHKPSDSECYTHRQNRLDSICIGLVRDRDHWRALVKTVMSLWLPWNVGKFLCSCTIGGFSRRVHLHEVSDICIASPSEVSKQTLLACSTDRTPGLKFFVLSVFMELWRKMQRSWLFVANGLAPKCHLSFQWRSVSLQGSLRLKMNGSRLCVHVLFCCTAYRKEWRCFKRY